MIKIVCMVLITVLTTSMCSALNIPFSITCEVYQPRLSSITFGNETKYTWDLGNLTYGMIDIRVEKHAIDFASINKTNMTRAVGLTCYDTKKCEICRFINYTIDDRPGFVSLYLTPNVDIIYFAYPWNETVIVSGALSTKLDENVLKFLDSIHVKGE